MYRDHEELQGREGGLDVCGKCEEVRQPSTDVPRGRQDSKYKGPEVAASGVRVSQIASLAGAEQAVRAEERDQRGCGETGHVGLGQRIWTDFVGHGSQRRVLSKEGA